MTEVATELEKPYVDLFAAFLALLSDVDVLHESDVVPRNVRRKKTFKGIAADEKYFSL